MASVLLATPSSRGHADPAPASGPAAASEFDRPHAGFVPGREGGPFWTRVLDAATGAPVAGATLVRHEESPWEGDLDHAAVLGVATTDDRGIAFIPRADSEADEKPAEGHWVVRAPGYASACEFGAAPPASVVLERGESVRIRVLDPFGCPAAGARVAWFDGCSHSPVLAEGVTDDEGRVRLDDVDPRRGRVWVESTVGGLLAPIDLDDLVGLGEREPTIVLHHGPTPRGIVVDPAGRPVRGAVLRSQANGCGPVATSGADGRFRLAVIPDADTLWVRPFELRADHVPALDDVDLAVPLRIVLTPNGLVPRTWAGARARDRRAAPRGLAEARLTSTSRSRRRRCREVGRVRPVEGRPGELVGTLEITPGRAHTVLVDEEAADAFVAPPFVAAPGAEVTVSVRRVPRAALRIKGEVPKGSTVVLVPGSANRRLDGVDEPIHLPRTARAMLRVDDELGLVRLFEVGEADAAGIRTAEVRFPAPHSVRWPPGVRVERVLLLRGNRDLRIDSDDGGFRTHATGACEVLVQLPDDEGVRRIPLRLPDDGPVVIEVDPRSIAPTAAPDRGSYRVIWPKEAGEGGSTSVSSGPGGGSWSMRDDATTASIGSEIVVSLPGFVRHRLVVTKAEAREIRWGTCSLDLGVFDADGRGHGRAPRPRRRGLRRARRTPDARGARARAPPPPRDRRRRGRGRARGAARPEGRRTSAAARRLRRLTATRGVGTDVPLSGRGSSARPGHVARKVTRR